MSRLTKTVLFPATLLAAVAAGCQSAHHEPKHPSGDVKKHPTKPAAPAAPAAEPERAGLVAVHGKPLTLTGTPVKVGDAAPAFAGVANDLSPYAFAPALGKVYVLSAVPSVDTPTCSAETKRFNEEAGSLGVDVQVVTVSMDLPFAQKRWCAAEGVKNLTTVSDYKDRSFGQHYGVRIKENGLLARAVWVVGKDGRVAYEQLVPELSQEPDYAPIMAAAKAAASVK